jgi:hypothetical protein
MRAAPSRDHGRGVPWGAPRPFSLTETDQRPGAARAEPTRTRTTARHRCLRVGRPWSVRADGHHRGCHWTRRPRRGQAANERPEAEQAGTVDRPAIQEGVASESRDSPGWPQFQAAPDQQERRGRERPLADRTAAALRPAVSLSRETPTRSSLSGNPRDDAALPQRRARECRFARMGAVAPRRGGAPGRRPRADERAFVRPWCGNPRCRNDPRSNATRSVVDWSPPRPTCSPLFRQGSAFFAALNSRGTRSSAIGTTPAPQSTRRSAEAQSADCLKVRVFRTILCGG